MKIDWSFIRLVVICFAGSFILICYPISELANRDIIRSIVAGGIMSFLNILLGYLSIEYSFERSYVTFLKFVFGGMVIRLMLMWGTFLILTHYYGFHPISLILTLLFFYVMNLVLEIYYLQKRMSLKE